MIVETFTFHLKPDADEAAFLDADARVQTDFYYAQRGCVRRTTARAADGEWLVVVLWSTSSEADAAAGAARTDDATRAFGAFLDEGTIRTKRYTPLD